MAVTSSGPTDIVRLGDGRAVSVSAAGPRDGFPVVYCLFCRRGWGFEPGDVRTPVTVWHARCDRLVPLAHTLCLAAAIPGCMTHVDPRGGHFFYSRRIAEIVGTLVPGGALPPQLTLLEPCPSLDTRPVESVSGKRFVPPLRMTS